MMLFMNINMIPLMNVNELLLTNICIAVKIAVNFLPDQWAFLILELISSQLRVNGSQIFIFSHLPI